MLKVKVPSLIAIQNQISEISLMSKEARRVATVRTKTKCDLFSLSRENFKIVLEEYPNVKDLMRRLAELRLQLSGFIDHVGNLNPEFW